MAIHTIRINPFKDPERVKSIWKSIETQSQISFFNSWGWVSTWLFCLPKNLDVELIVNIENDIPSCCFFIGITHQRVNKFKKVRGYINNTGFENYDDLVIEYNSILCATHDIDTHLSFALSSLNDIEEFRFSHTVNIDFDAISGYVKRVNEYPSYWVDLKNIDVDKGYLSYISKNKRNQIKRSIKAYEANSKLNIEFATTLEQAQSFFKSLENLHQQEWLQRGKPGAFGEPFFKQFHDQLIATRFEHGEIQLIRIFNEHEDIGYIYNFVFKNEVLFYQCGFNYHSDNKYRPGLVSHYLAINECLAKGFSKYNFLVGQTQYKQSLSTQSDMLKTAVVSRNNLKSKFESSLRALKSKL